MWSQIDLYLNGPLVNQSNNNYPYRAYIENLLSFSQDAKSSQLSALLWYRNTAGQFDTQDDANSGYTTRKALVAHSNQIDMMGRLHVDLSFQNRYLLNEVEVCLRLIRSKKVFCLHGWSRNWVNFGIKKLSQLWKDQGKAIRFRKGKSYCHFTFSKTAECKVPWKKLLCLCIRNVAIDIIRNTVQFLYCSGAVIVNVKEVKNNLQ